MSMATSGKDRFTRIDEGVYEKDGKVFEEKAGKMVETGATVEPAQASPGTDLAVVPKFNVAAVDRVFDNVQALTTMMKNRMKENHHFGKVPGAQNPSLWEPGASLIMNGFGLFADPVNVDRTEDEDGHIRYNVTVYLRPIGPITNVAMAAGVASCSSREIKYAYRWVFEDEIPSGIEKADLRSRTVRGDKVQYRIPNQDPGDLENTIIKMAVKRAEVDAVMHLPGCSELFPREGSRQVDTK